MFTVMVCDLSTSCTGVLIGGLQDRSVVSLETFPIIPPAEGPEAFGFMKTKKKVKSPTGKEITTYVYPGETVVTVAEKDKRNRMVRNGKRTNKLKAVSAGLSQAIRRYQPDLIIFETNMSFGGILTTKQLAEVAGALQALAVAFDVEVKEINVNKARAKFNMAQLVREYALGKTPQQLKATEDVAKAALKEKMLDKYEGYDLDPDMTLDESDALVIFDHWYEEGID